MENQHEKISGYRDLTQAEIDVMNRIKDLGAEVGLLLEALDPKNLPFAGARAQQVSMRDTNYLAHELYLARGQGGVDARWLAIAKTDLQKGFMFLTRAVAQPTTF